jgi:hypothetical protein
MRTPLNNKSYPRTVPIQVKAKFLNSIFYSINDGVPIIGQDRCNAPPICGRRPNIRIFGLPTAEGTALWCSEQQNPFVTCEDDAVLREDIADQLPRLISRLDDWDIIMLGFNLRGTR